MAMTYRILCAPLATVLLAAPAMAQTERNGAVARYIDGGFAAMDADNNGQVDRAEFGRFMQARLARQAQKFDAAMADIDTNKDGSISKAEAASTPGLAANFAAIDIDNSQSLSKKEIQIAAAQAQMQEAGAN